MHLDVIGQRIERAFNPRAITFVRSNDAEPCEISAAKRIGREQAMQIAALYAAVGGDRSFWRAIDEGKGTSAVASLGAADMDFVGLDWLLRLGMLSLGSREA